EVDAALALRLRAMLIDRRGEGSHGGDGDDEAAKRHGHVPMAVMSRWSCLGGEAGRLPADDAAGEMAVVRKACRLAGLRGGDRAPSRATGEHHLPRTRIGNAARIE